MIGTQLANYLVQEKLGEGGMGVVFKGIDLNLDRPVAIKVLSPALAQDPELVERFRIEAKALANLNHVNIATLYSLQNINGQYLMVMEFLEGDTFDHLIRQRGTFGCEEAIRLIKQALLGLGFAHRRGVVHRDIKPSNIMLTRAGIVKVMDFGIAKVLGGERLTRTGAQLGTLAYMSPEQIRNDPVDGRSDIYSLSITLFKMLSGHLPFSGASDYELMSAHLQTPPPRLTRHCPDIAIAVEQVVLKGLEKTPGARFQTAEEFGAALEKAQAPVAARSSKADRPPATVEIAPPAVPASPRKATPPAPPPKQVSPVAPSQPKAVSPAAPPIELPRQRIVVPPARSSPAPKASPIRHASPVPQGRAAKKSTQAFISLAISVAGVFCLFFAGLYMESVPMLLACIVLLYFLPILVAAMQLKRNGAAVVKLNVLRGWTGIGWIEAMKKALTEDD